MYSGPGSLPAGSIPEWLRRKRQLPVPERPIDRLERELQDKIDRGEITAEEAEMEWQDFMHKSEVWQEW